MQQSLLKWVNIFIWEWSARKVKIQIYLSYHCWADLDEFRLFVSQSTMAVQFISDGLFPDIKFLSQRFRREATEVGSNIIPRIFWRKIKLTELSEDM